MNKRLHFVSNLVPLILSGEKTVTWRLWDDKDLSVGDILECIQTENEVQFATVHVVGTLEKPLGSLTEEDKLRHEKFSSDSEMYQTYTRYYSRPVDENTLVKIVWFELVKK